MKLRYSIKIVLIFTVSLLAAVASAGFCMAADLDPTGPYEYEIGAAPPQAAPMQAAPMQAAPMQEMMTPPPGMVALPAPQMMPGDYDPAQAPLSRTQRFDRMSHYNNAIRQASGVNNNAARPRDAMQAAPMQAAPMQAAPDMAPITQGKPRYDRGQATEDVAIGKDDGDSTMKPAAKAKPGKPAQMSIAGVNGSQEIDYVAVNQSVALAARELGQAVGLRVVAGPSVDGTIRKRHFKGLFPMLMDSLAKEYSLFWFPDGGVIYVEPLADQQTKVVKLKNVSAEQLYEAMDLAGLTAVKNRVIAAPGDGAVRVIGPDSFQKVIATLMTTLEPAEAPDIKIISYGRRAS